MPDPAPSSPWVDVPSAVDWPPVTLAISSVEALMAERIALIMSALDSSSGRASSAVA